MDTTPANSAPTAPSGQRLDPLIEQVSSGWKYFFAHFQKLFGISLVMFVAQIIGLVIMIAAFALIGFSFFSGTTTATPAAGAMISGIVLMVIIGLALAYLSLWMTVAVYRFVLSGATLTVRQAYAEGREYIWSYFGTSILLGLYVGLGTLLLIVPGIYWGILYGFAPIIILAEGKKVRAFERSKQLVKGNWWQVFWRFFVFGISVYIASILINIVVNLLGASLGAIYSPLKNITTFSSYLSNVILAPISLVFEYVIYQNLKKLKG